MTFTNPVVVNVTTQTVTLPPVLYTDYWLWNAIQGESYAPTLNGWTYGAYKDRPCFISSSSVSNNATFTALPRIGPAQAAAGTVTFSFNFAQITPGNSPVQQMGVQFLFGLTNYKLFLNFYTGNVSPGFLQLNGTTFNPTNASAVYADNLWHSCGITFNESAQAVTWTLDGLTITTSAPMTGISTANNALQAFFGQSANSYGILFSNLRIQWS